MPSPRVVYLDSFNESGCYQIADAILDKTLHHIFNPLAVQARPLDLFQITVQGHVDLQRVLVVIGAICHG